MKPEKSTNSTLTLRRGRCVKVICSDYHVKEVFANMSEHARKRWSQQVLNTRRPTDVLAISLQVIDVLKVNRRQPMMKISHEKN